MDTTRDHIKKDRKDNGHGWGGKGGKENDHTQDNEGFKVNKKETLKEKGVDFCIHENQKPYNADPQQKDIECQYDWKSKELTQ